VRIKEKLKVSRSGCVNGLLLTSRTNFTAVTEQLGACVSYCQPVILPLKHMDLSEGSTVEVLVEFEMAGGFDSLQYSALVD
jgi:hypothetical protein